MADLTYSASETQTRNRARLVSLHLERLRNPDGSFTGQVQIHGVAQVGQFASGVFTQHTTVSFTERMTTAAAASFFGASVLNGMEQKMLERMQVAGVLPAGTIS